MLWTVGRAGNASQEIAAANYPGIRLFSVDLEDDVPDRPRADVQGCWSACSPQTVKDFSAVGYFFAREIYRNRHVPVGIIQSARGGSPVESFIRHAALEADPAFRPVLDNWQNV